MHSKKVSYFNKYLIMLLMLQSAVPIKTNELLRKKNFMWIIVNVL